MDHAEATPLSLYPAQQRGVGMYLERPDARLLLAYGTGCGKTPTAIGCVKAHAEARYRDGLASRRILIVCPAMVRRHWVREFLRWAAVSARAVEMGRNTQSGTKAQRAARDEAYAASIQICSYDLMPEVDAKGWDYLIFDEIHHLGDPTSRQSRRAHNLLQLNHKVPTLGLSATLLPTDLKQLWNPLRLLWGEREWGWSTRTGGVSWTFAKRYCGLIENDYGCAIGGGIPEALPELKDRLSRIAHQVNRTDISANMPPLTVRMLDIPGEGLSIPGRNTKPLKEQPAFTAAVNWFKDLPEDIHHAVILVYHRDKAAGLASHLATLKRHSFKLFTIDGSMTPDQREKILNDCEDTYKGVLVATTESLKEGIRLMWAQQVLLAEWRQSPAQVLQVLGRFQSVGDTRRPVVEILIDERMHHEAQRLIERVEVMNSVLKTDGLAKEIPNLFKPQDLSEETMRTLTLNLFDTFDAEGLKASFNEDSEVEVDD